MNTKNKESNYQIDFHMHSTCSDGADDVATINHFPGLKTGKSAYNLRDGS